jgi:endogenous inhibitor of DNA gyrase (YacG/DUF329 family)
MKCPICHRPTTYEGNPSRPFCSERCKLIDFGAWANEEYAVPAEEALPQPEDSPQGTSSSEEELQQSRER